MVPVGNRVMLELVLAVHSYHMIAYLVYSKCSFGEVYRWLYGRKCHFTFYSDASTEL